jgi:hypothetical protein
MTKYEALEKNAVSEPKMPPLGNLKYSRNSRKASLYWEIFGLFIDGEIRLPVRVAEGEELGSNLLRVFHRIGTCQIVHTLGGNPGREVAVKGSGGWQQQRRRLSGLVAQE